MLRGKNQTSLKHDVALAEVTEPAGTPKGISELFWAWQGALILLRFPSKSYHLLDSPVSQVCSALHSKVYGLHYPHSTAKESETR